ncbi:WD40 repeat-like protein [Xylaria castorea]|nr:WD40 repeat-like protein [Xylaria castorea]
MGRLGYQAVHSRNITSFRGLRRIDSDLTWKNELFIRRDTGKLATHGSSKPPDSSIGDILSDPIGPHGLNLLYSPSEPIVDIIFVHGLGGGSRKTWSKTELLNHYWPKEWLPKDVAFERVRIQSFGYNSDWAKSKDNCLNLHHFGKALLGHLATSPLLVNHSTPIILVGHSMGGLVIKKAYILARQDATYEGLSNRIHSMYFLATPHRGSDSARLLKNILQATALSRDYVGDIEMGSAALRSINDEFRQYSRDVSLWSFYETEKLSIGLLSVLIVNPDSATLGYPDEKQMPMNADHRSICKFDTPSDPNYIILRNALAVTVNAVKGLSMTNLYNCLETKLISEIASKADAQLCHEQVAELQSYLAVKNSVEDDLNSLNDTRLSGTCEWVLGKKRFIDWIDSNSFSPPILWLTGKPASGKSTLTSYIVEYLRSIDVSCCYFFFKHSDKSTQRLAACLRSLAFQMTKENTQVRQKLLQLEKEGVQLDFDNPRAIWRSLFVSGIFEVTFPRQFWIIDGLDECSDTEHFFEPMLGKLSRETPVRILITSRETAELKNHFFELGPDRVATEAIVMSDTQLDIRLLVETKAQTLPVRDDRHRASLVNKILEKSMGSFLWTSLVLRELAASYSEEDIKQILEEVPRDMETLYERTLDTMSRVVRGKDLMRAVLIWTVCALRPLTVSELDTALKTHTRDTFPQLKQSITALCGQIIVIDKFNKVQIIHETAKAYLLGGTTSEFAVDMTQGHTSIARVCLEYLVGEEMKPPRTGRRVPGIDLVARRSAFSSYACHSVFWHLSKADPRDVELYALVDRLLSSNILSWIEAIAMRNDLMPLIRASKHLRAYYKKCTMERSPLEREMNSIKGWAFDLMRITAKFSRVLTTYPAAIHSLILPLCPRGSIIYKIGTTGRRLTVIGLSNLYWDDRLTSIQYQYSQTSVICHGDGFFAVGLADGSIYLYHSNSCQEYKVLRHGEAVKLLYARQKTDLLASCGMKFVHVWNIRTGIIVYSAQSPPRPSAMIFDGGTLLVASAKNKIASWDIDSDGLPQLDRPWSNLSGDLRRQPCAVTLSISHRMLAAAYSGMPIILWDLDEDFCYGTCGKKMPDGETCTHMVTSMIFNPISTIELLAASYLDGDLALLNPFSDLELARVRANCHTLAASPDGRLLAGGAGSGIIQIYEFETLKLLYRVKASELFVKQLEFSRDGLQLLDIRGPQCNVWEPAVLLKDYEGDDSSDGTTASIVEMATIGSRVKISTIALHARDEVAFCGKDDGSVVLFSLKTASPIREIYKHKSPVKFLIWWQRQQCIMSVDVSNMITAKKIRQLSDSNTTPDTSIFQSRLGTNGSIVQVLQNEAVGRFIVSTRESDHLWDIDGHVRNVRQYNTSTGIRMWAQHPQSPEHVMCVDGETVRILAWNNWEIISASPININLERLQLKGLTTHVSRLKTQSLLIELSELNGSARTCGLHLLDISGLPYTNHSPSGNLRLPSESKEIPAKSEVLALIQESQISALGANIAHVIQLDSRGHLLFLDNQSWVASADLATLSKGTLSYSRHFFVPHEWLSGSRSIVITVCRREIIVARNEDLVVIKGGLDFAEKVDIDVHDTKAAKLTPK